ncbi:MAG: O-antigen ligase family protein [Candidatus Zixiibacteriota bacterium]
MTQLAAMDRDIDLKRAVALILIASFLFATVLVAIGRPLPALALLTAPAVAYLYASPRACFYIFLVSIGFHLPYFIGTFALWPFDIALVVLFSAILLDFLLHRQTDIRRTEYDLAFFFLIGATWLSALFAFDRSQAIVPSFRIMAIYIAFRAVFKMSSEIGVRKIVLFYIWQVFALSVVNIFLFLMAGGKERVFGPSWLAFENYSMTAVPMALAFFIWADSTRERLMYALVAIVILFAVAASGSRGSMLAIALALPVLVIAARWKACREGNRGAVQAANRIIVVAGVGVALVLFLGTVLFGGFLERVGELVDSFTRPQGTIALRLVLWKAAIEGFLTSPLVGIGIGNYTSVDQIIPAIKAEPVWYYIRGMTAHNVVLHYLAETGIIGAAALLTLAGTGLATAHRRFRPAMGNRDTQVTAALFIMMVVFVMSLFFMRAWTWSQEGYVLAIIFGLNAASGWGCPGDSSQTCPD